MKKLLLLSLLSLLVSSTYADSAPDKQALMQESKTIVQTFGKTLKGELKAAIKNGGPVNGIQVCNTKAMPITEKVATENGVMLSRTSLKVRNAENQPETWEKAVLEQFETRKANGESVKTMAFSEVVETNGVKQFRFVKALGTEPVCMTCHGAKIHPDVENALTELYPNDKARGYKVGDIRGAIVLIKDIK
jgi:hypothetical protein